MLNTPLGFLGWAVARAAGTQFVGPAGSGCRTEQEEERVEWQACGSRDCSSEPVQPRCRALIWSEPALALSLGLPLMGHQAALHRPSARRLGSPLLLTCLLTQPLGCTVTDLETRDPRGQTEAMRASLGAQPRDGRGIPQLLPIYGREEAAALGRARGIVLRGCLASSSDSWILVKPWQGNCLTALTMCWSLQGSPPLGAEGM